MSPNPIATGSTFLWYESPIWRRVGDGGHKDKHVNRHGEVAGI